MRKIYYGWLVVIGGFILMATSWGIVYNTASLFLVPISEEMGFLRSQINLTMTLRGLVQLVLALLAGKVYRRFSLLNSMKLMSLVLVLSYIFLAQVNSLWQIYLFTLTGSLANSFLGVVPISVLVGNWFREKRGFALGLAFMGSGFGGMFFSSLTGYWIINYGWRMAYRFQALAMLFLVVPTVFLLIKEKPQDLNLEVYGSFTGNEEEGGMDFDDVLRLPYFWTLLGLSTLINFFMGLGGVSLAPHLIDRGYNFTYAANILALGMAALAFGKLALGHLLDRFGLRFATSLSIGGLLMITLGLIFSQHRPALILVIAGLGIGSAFGTMVDPFMARELFGGKDYNSIYGVMAAFSSLGNMIAPLASGLSYDMHQSYEPILRFSLLAAIIIFFINQWIFSANNINQIKKLWKAP